MVFFASPRPPQDLPESTPRLPETPPRPFQHPQRPPKTCQRAFQDSLICPESRPRRRGRCVQSPPYYSRVQVTRAPIPSSPQKTSRLPLRTPFCPWLQKASFFMTSTGLFTVPHFPLAQINRTRSPTKAGWLTVCRGPCFFVTFCFLWFLLHRFFLHFSRSTPKGPPPRRRCLTFFIFPWIYLFVVLFFFLFVVFCTPRLRLGG